MPQLAELGFPGGAPPGALLGVDNESGSTIVFYTLVGTNGVSDSITGSVLSISGAGGGGGSVTGVNFASANGFAGTFTSGATPTGTITTTVTGITKGAGGALVQAVAGTDYVLPSGNITGTAGGLSANIAESQVTSLATDLGTLTTGISTLTTNLATAVTNAAVASNLTSGTLPAARLPNPSASTLGGIQSAVVAAHQWINAISTSGVPSQSQPAFTDITGTVTTAQIATSAVTYSTIQHVSPTVLLGNPTGSAGVLSEISVGTGFSFVGTTLTYTSPTSGTVTNFVVNAGSGITWTLATPTTTPTLTPVLGNITPTQLTIANGAGSNTLSLNPTALPTPQSGSVLQVGNANATTTRLELDSYGATSYLSLVYTANTITVPGAVPAATEMGGINAWGYNSAAVVGPRAGIRFYGNQLWTTTANGTYVDIAATPNGATAEAQVAQFNGSGAVIIPGTATGGDQGAGTVNVAGGFYVKGKWIGLGAGGLSWVLGGRTNLVVATNVTQFTEILQVSGVFTRVDMSVGTNNAGNVPTGAAIIVDILLSANGGTSWTSLWSVNPGNRPSIAAGAYQGSVTAFDTAAYAAGDLVRVDIVQVGSTNPGSNLKLKIY